MKQDLREALSKVRNPPSFTLRKDPFECTSTVQFQITDIPLTDRKRLNNDHLLMSLRFFNLPLVIGPNDSGLPF